MSSLDRVPSEPLPDAPSHAGLGPYAVGVRTDVATDAGRVDVLALKNNPDARYDRTLRYEIWYPTDARGTPTTYADVLMADQSRAQEPFEMPGRALRDA